MSVGPIHIRVQEGPTPKQCYMARRVPINLEEAYRQEIEKQLEMGILERAVDKNNPSEWLHPLVVT